MAFERSAYNPVGGASRVVSGGTDPFAAYQQYGKTRMAALTPAKAPAIDPFSAYAEYGMSRMAGLVSGAAENPSPLYQPEIMDMLTGATSTPVASTDRKDGSEWLAGAMNLVGAMVDRSMGVPAEASNPFAAQPVFLGGGAQQSSGMDMKTIAMFAGGAALLYLIAKAV